MLRITRLFLYVGAAIAAAPSTAATDYAVGPGLEFSAIGDVPWEALEPGDRVLVHWRATAYNEKWVIARRGTEQEPIVIRGVPGPGGELPLIDGRNATTRPQLDYWNEERGVIKIGGSSIPADTLPAHIILENLEIRSARPPYDFNDDSGTTRTYADNAAAIYVEKAEHLTIRNCVLHDAGNGIFIGDFGGQTTDVRIKGNWIYDNGIVGSAFQHNTYTAAIGIVYEDNLFGSLRAGAEGNNLKDRSAGLVVRYNWIEDGNRQLDLVDADAEVASEPSYRQTYVYGNVLIESDGEGNSQIVHYGGDSGDTSQYRKGDLFFYNNTVVSTRSGNTTLLRLSTGDEHADVRNNILYVSAAGHRLAILDSAGVLDLRNNWLKEGWSDSHSGLSGTINDDGSNIAGSSPGFADESLQDFHLSPGSETVGASTTPHAATLPLHLVARHYVKHLRSAPRPTTDDLGAFELCASSGCGLLFADGFESADTSAWSASH